MNEVQIIRQHLETERTHFAEIATACRAAIEADRFQAADTLAAALAEYLRFAAGRLPATLLRQPPPEVSAPVGRWREFLSAFEDAAARHFEDLDRLAARAPSVVEWRAISAIDADTIVDERTRYLRVKAALR